VLLTPEVFKRPHSRLYGWLLPTHQRDPASLARDLADRAADAAGDGDGSHVDWSAVSSRLGWFTFEDV
jgi:hypothetical protein